MWIKDIKDTQTVHHVRSSVRLSLHSAPSVFPSRLYVNEHSGRCSFSSFSPSLPPSSHHSLVHPAVAGCAFSARALPSFLLSARDVSSARKKIRGFLKLNRVAARATPLSRGGPRFRSREPEIPGPKLLRNGVIRIERLCGAPCVSLGVARTYIVHPTLHPRHR